MVLIEKDGWTLSLAEKNNVLKVTHFCEHHSRKRTFSPGWNKCFACESFIPDLINITAALIDPLYYQMLKGARYG